jgi:hypothetical protein
MADYKCPKCQGDVYACIHKHCAWLECVRTECAWEGPGNLVEYPLPSYEELVDKLKPKESGCEE